MFWMFWPRGIWEGVSGDSAHRREHVATYQRPDYGAEVEDHPEPRDVPALVVLLGVRHHDGALGGPEHTGAEAEEGAGEVDEADILVMGVGEEGGDVDGVADAAERERHAHTEDVGDGAGEEGDDGEGRVQGRVGLGGGADVGQAHAAHAAEGVEHAGAQEADHGDHEELGARRGVPDLLAEDAEALVLPSVGALDGAGVFRGVGVVDDGLAAIVDVFLGHGGVGEKSR